MSPWTNHRAQIVTSTLILTPNITLATHDKTTILRFPDPVARWARSLAREGAHFVANVLAQYITQEEEVGHEKRVDVNGPYLCGRARRGDCSSSNEARDNSDLRTKLSV